MTYTPDTSSTYVGLAHRLVANDSSAIMTMLRQGVTEIMAKVWIGNTRTGILDILSAEPSVAADIAHTTHTAVGDILPISPSVGTPAANDKVYERAA